MEPANKVSGEKGSQKRDSGSLLGSSTAESPVKE